MDQQPRNNVGEMQKTMEEKEQWKKYADLEHKECMNVFVLGDKSTPYTWATFAVPGNRICWKVFNQLGIEDIADEQFKSCDWEPQQHKAMMDSIPHFKTTNGTLGDLFDATPIKRVSRVLLPSPGAGAVNATQGAVFLVNHIYDIVPMSFDIMAALNEYKEERFDTLTEQYS
ncbi:hypothetical protein BGZ97_010803 [Linnemannia gamsii]|uniref:Uncharacterized protein n=1 Tax=Linnemannia gamsii TaxID=64522 RepID=A0A9P6R7E8_9FUNG|nr:hypothetical protein BGZ97_010803 [Linnemannia gamsii]